MAIAIVRVVAAVVMECARQQQNRIYALKASVARELSSGRFPMNVHVRIARRVRDAG